VQQLVIQFPLKARFPNGSEVEAVTALEDRLEQLSDGDFEVDGHDAGGGEMNIFIITENAATTLESIRAELPNDQSWCAGFRDLDSEDYSPLAPPDLAAFTIH
jgi:hypothetical protein